VTSSSSCKYRSPKLKPTVSTLRVSTYDAQDVLSAFTQAYKIEYPMLSDVGSKVIRAFVS